MEPGQILSALADELALLTEGLLRLQDVPLIAAADGTPLSGEALLTAIVALQDLDRMAQTAGALSAFAAEVATDGAVSAKAALESVPLRSVADRLRERLG